MKPEPSAFTSFCSRIGSPAMNGARAIEPVISFIASALLARLMKLLLALAAGQVCHCRSSGLTDWPRPMSDLATRISTVGICATAGFGAGLSLGPAGEICGNAAGADSDGQDHHARRYSYASLSTLRRDASVAVMGVEQLFVKAWLMRRV